MDAIKPIATNTLATTRVPLQVIENITEQQGNPLSHQVSAERRKWNNPRGNIFRLVSVFLSFFLLGCNDSSYGFLIPQYLAREYYSVNYTSVSLVFLTPIIGFIISTLSNYPLHWRIGQRGVAIVTGSTHLIAFAVICLHPPFTALIVVYILVGLGSGAKNGAWNTWVGSLANPNEVLGLLQGMYGVGATLTPPVASTLISRRGWHWYEIFYLFLGLALLDLCCGTAAFMHCDGPTFQSQVAIHEPDLSRTLSQANSNSNSNSNSKPKSTSALKRLLSLISQNEALRILKNRIVLICAAFLLVYIGAEVAIGGWLVTLMIEVRHATPLVAGTVNSGYWAGITVGRITLGFVSGRFFKNEKRAVTVYVVLAIAMQLVFWLVPDLVASAVAVALLGFFLGPLFPGLVVSLSKLLPRDMRLIAISVCSAVGASGACILPFMVGALAQAKGVRLLQPMILAALVVCLVLWLFLPVRNRKMMGTEKV